MASKALMTCSASGVMANKASLSPSSLGSVPRSVFFSSPARTASSATSKGSFGVRAQQYGVPQYGSPQYGSEPFSTSTPYVSKQQQQGPQPFSSPTQGLVHTPWYTTEDESAIKMRIDMPGLSAEDIDVKVEGDMLVIKDLGRQIFSPYDTKIQLPPDCVKEQAVATLKNGVLHVSAPKKFPPKVVHIPVKTTRY